MAIAHFSKVFGFFDAKVYAMTADTAGSLTYGTGIDIPGVKTLEISGTIDRKSLRGDNGLLDIFSVLTDVSVALGHAKVSLDILSASLGGAVVDSGTTPNQKATWSLTSSSAPKYFKVEGRTPTDGVDFIGGDAHLVIYKGVLSDFPGVGFADEDYALPSLGFGTVPTINNGKWIDVVFNETQVAVT